MATLLQLGSVLLIQGSVLVKTSRRRQAFTCTNVATITTTPHDKSPIIPRRSANYQPSLWDNHHLLSVENQYSKNESVVGERDLLKEKVRKMFDDESRTYLDQLEFIDDLQKLGLSYHFQPEIENILLTSYQKGGTNVNGLGDLHATALEFRLFRQHGFDISEDIFDVFMEKRDKFERDDINGFLSLYEASYLSTKSDTKMQKYVRPFATQQLRNFVEDFGSCNVVREMVIHALDMPHNWRMRSLATRWYIDFYGHKQNANLDLIEFARLDFNIVQGFYQEELKYVSRWWKETDLGNILPFARDRIVENYFWSVGQIQEPQYGYARKTMTKVISFVTIIDDIYDIYGTTEELQLFTSAFEHWDINRLDELPEYMRLCFLVVYNEINNIGYDILKNKHINVIPFLKKSWTDLCKAYLVEANWYKSGHKPNLEEYMKNGWVTIAAPMVFVHFYCVYSDQISIQVLEALCQHQENVSRCSASVFRLANDLVTSTDELARGDVLKSIQCYMNETGASEEEARSHVRQMITDLWDEMNYDKMAHSSSLLHHDFMEIVINMARMSLTMYQYGDGCWDFVMISLKPFFIIFSLYLSLCIISLSLFSMLYLL